MPFWKCYYHVIWATKHRQPIITSTIETVIYSAIERKCRELPCELLGVNGVSDHIHMALTIPPSQNVAYVVGQIKGASSREVNQSFDLPERFQWQEGYGVLTFGEKVMPLVLDYIARQKEHHAQDTALAYMEQMDE